MDKYKKIWKSINQNSDDIAEDKTNQYKESVPSDNNAKIWKKCFEDGDIPIKLDTPISDTFYWVGDPDLWEKV